MSVKDCAHHHNGRQKLYRRLLIAAGGFVILVLALVFLVWLILHPTKPRFVLQDATVYNFNISTPPGATMGPPNLLTTNIQVTLMARNPNGHVGIYYDRLDVYAAYRAQQITLATLLPATYQGHKDVAVWSPFLNGNAVPVAPYIGTEMSQDENAGMVMINIRVDGRIRWKVGSFISGKYRLYANCPAYLSFGGQYSPNAILVGSTAKYQLVQNCHVDV